VDLVPFAVEQAKVRGLRQLACHGVAERALLQLFPVSRVLQGQGGLPRLQSFEGVRRAQGEIHGEGAAGHRAYQPAAARVRLPDRFQVLENRLRVGAVVEQRGNHHRTARIRGKVVQEGHRRVAAFGEHEYPAPGLLQPAHERAHFPVVGEARGHGRAAFAVVRRRGAGREADRAGAHPVDHDAAHGRHFVVGGDALRGGLAHHVGADGRVPGKHRDVGGRAAALEQVEVLRQALEIPADAAFQDLERHPFHLGQVAHHALAVGRSARRDGKAAVADHRGGYAELRRGRDARIPGDLRVVMRVVVDDPGHQRQAGGIEGGFRRSLDRSHAGNLVPRNRQIAPPGRGAQAVDEQGVADHQIVHRIHYR
jgi:hypothetical protein